MLNKLMKLKNKKGFTLVELIVVIAIIAILTAIIVPLVGRYSAQARYTTLNDAATTISNSINNGLSDANQIGVINVTQITGFKTNGVLTIKVGTTASATSAADKLDATTHEYKATGGTDAENRAASRIVGSLADALPDNCTFYASIRTSTVSGVVYYNSKDDEITTDPGTDAFGMVAGFDNAYAETGSGGSATDAKGEAVGLSGQYIPATPGDDD